MPVSERSSVTVAVGDLGELSHCPVPVSSSSTPSEATQSVFKHTTDVVDLVVFADFICRLELNCLTI